MILYEIFIGFSRFYVGKIIRRKQRGVSFITLHAASYRVRFGIVLIICLLHSSVLLVAERSINSFTADLSVSADTYVILFAAP